MHAYIVRLRKNTELVGLFVSPSDEMLWEFVDECCDPGECEFVRLPAGGLYLHQAGAPKVPTLIRDPEDEKSYPDWFSQGTISELWLDIFYGGQPPEDWCPVQIGPLGT